MSKFAEISNCFFYKTEHIQNVKEVSILWIDTVDSLQTNNN